MLRRLRLRALAYDKPLCASLDGFTLHAATRAGGLHAEGREALLRYVLRPPIAQERVEQQPDGLVRITLKKAYADGTVAVDMDPLSCCAGWPPACPRRGSTRSTTRGYSPQRVMAYARQRQQRRRGGGRKGWGMRVGCGASRRWRPWRVRRPLRDPLNVAIRFARGPAGRYDPCAITRMDWQRARFAYAPRNRRRRLPVLQPPDRPAGRAGGADHRAPPLGRTSAYSACARATWRPSMRKTSSWDRSSATCFASRTWAASSPLVMQSVHQPVPDSGQHAFVE